MYYYGWFALYDLSTLQHKHSCHQSRISLHTKRPHTTLLLQILQTLFYQPKYALYPVSHPRHRLHPTTIQSWLQHRPSKNTLWTKIPLLTTHTDHLLMDTALQSPTQLSKSSKTLQSRPTDHHYYTPLQPPTNLPIQNPSTQNASISKNTSPTPTLHQLGKSFTSPQYISLWPTSITYKQSKHDQIYKETKQSYQPMQPCLMQQRKEKKPTSACRRLLHSKRCNHRVYRTTRFS